MKFYTEEITVMVDGTSAVAITEKATDIEARSSFHQIMASAMINENVASVHAEAKNSVGGIYESATWTRPVPEPPTPEPPTPEPPTPEPPTPEPPTPEPPTPEPVEE